MLKLLTDKINRSGWEGLDKRYQRLDVLDRFLDGTFYDHLPYAFYQEEDSMKKYIPLWDRRPSARYPLPSTIAKLCARKLFAGRHAPRIIHPDKRIQLIFQKLAEECKLEQLMCQAATWGSVGSVAMTFKVIGEGNLGKLRAFPWRSKYCEPKFDKFGNLSRLRIAYIANGYELLARGWTLDVEKKEIEGYKAYWRVFDMVPAGEIHYFPIIETKWRTGTESDLPLIAEEAIKGVGFTQAHWFTNLAGGRVPDGICTFEEILPLAIDIDYTLSQLGRGVRYNASPQVVFIGQTLQQEEGVIPDRNPKTILQFREPTKDSSGDATGGGNAKLLEMTGEGIRVGLEYMERLRKLALESAAAVLKDPDKAGSLITGKAMEALDENLVDLVQELRTSYGTHGELPMLKNMGVAAIRAKHPLMKGVTEQDCDGLMLQWPLIHTPTPDEVQKLVQAMGQAVGGPGTEGKPPTPALIDLAMAKGYLIANIDFPPESTDFVNTAEFDRLDTETDEKDLDIEEKVSGDILPPKESEAA